MNGGRLSTAPQFCKVIYLMVGITILAAGCHRAADAAPEITVREQITPQPVRVGPETITVQLADATSSPVTHAAIMVEADMSHPGMSPAFAQARESTPGSYRANVNFSMGGDWILLLHIRLADGRRIERQLDVRGVRSN
jgi:YtkA-like